MSAIGSGAAWWRVVGEGLGGDQTVLRGAFYRGVNPRIVGRIPTDAEWRPDAVGRLSGCPRSGRSGSAIAVGAHLGGIVGTGMLPSAMAAEEQVPRALEFESLGNFGGAATGAVGVGSTLFLSIGRYLEVRDVSDSAAPVTLGRSPRLPSGAVLAAAGAGAAYLVERRRDQTAPDADILHVVDISTSASPRLQSSTAFEAYSLNAIVAVGNYVYAGGRFGIAVIDATDQASPGQIALLDLGWTDALVVLGDTLVASAGESLLVFSTLDRALPVRLGQLGAITKSCGRG